jgi:hypothetical protein
LADPLKQEITLARARVATTALACTCNVTSFVLLTFRDWKMPTFSGFLEGLRGLIEDIFYYPLANYSLWIGPSANYGTWVYYSLLLAPTVAVILLRKHLIATSAYALILLCILTAQIYYVLPTSLTGLGSTTQRFDPSAWALAFVGIGSLVIVGFCAVLCAFELAERLARKWQAKS